MNNQIQEANDYAAWLVIVQNKTPEEIDRLEKIITFWRRQSNKLTGTFNLKQYAKLITNGTKSKKEKTSAR